MTDDEKAKILCHLRWSLIGIKVKLKKFKNVISEADMDEVELSIDTADFYIRNEAISRIQEELDNAVQILTKYRDS